MYDVKSTNNEEFGGTSIPQIKFFNSEDTCEIQFFLAAIFMFLSLLLEKKSVYVKCKLFIMFYVTIHIHH